MGSDKSQTTALVNVLTKTTMFTGRASGDGESFCFDTRTEKQMMRDDQLPLDERIDADEGARIYPDVFIPVGAGERMGRWTITVTFEPNKLSEP
jgi:hypothetical protein